MIDREKVIKGLEACAGTNTDGAADCVLECPYKGSFYCIDRLMYDALELLKEQPEIVWCKDCKHIERINGINGCGYRCELWEYSSVLKDGFCNYGERKEKL